jgi:hypothetical protein
MIRVHKHPEYTCEQPKDANLPRCPVRMLITAPSFSGKTVLLVSLMKDLYKNCFHRIYIFSRNIFVDPQWNTVRQMQDSWNIDPDEQLYFPEFGNADLERICKRQQRVIQMYKEKGLKKMPQIAIILDDFIDDPATKNYQALHRLALMGRHFWISTFISSQKLRSISTIVRTNFCSLVFFRLRNYKELEALIEEFSALLPKETMLEIYNAATKKQFDFLYINLLAHDPRDMFFRNFDTRLTPQDL